MKKFLIIQTAFIGDVVLATALVEKLAAHFPEASIDFLVRKGNETLLENNPHLDEVLIWNKKKKKLRNLWKMIGIIRKRKYDYVINVQRFAATGIMTSFSGARQKIGFDKNPLSFLFSKKVKHFVDPIGKTIHEVERNQELISHITDDQPARPRMYPSTTDLELVRKYKSSTYITISPASVWFTKQYPKEKWISFLNMLPAGLRVYVLGAGSDKVLVDEIINSSESKNTINLSGQLTFLQSSALMKDALMNYVNDSAPMHFASAVNAPVSAIYCSTIPAFGFGPLSDLRFIVETTVELSCRPCGLHGWKACPLGHFNCAYTITDEQLLMPIQSFISQSGHLAL